MTLYKGKVLRPSQATHDVVGDLRPLVGDYRPTTYLRYTAPPRTTPPAVSDATHAVARASIVASASELAAAWVRHRQQRENLDHEIEPRVQLLAKVLAERLLERELQLTPDAILYLTREVFQALPPAEPVRLRAHPADVVTLEKHRADLALSPGTLQIVADPHRTRGSIRAESELGTLDADLSARLDRLLAALREP
jgi:flagellar biosynthesis/type III secretory pathway protein FliH